ncbi:tetratricopeptide repeat protein [Cellulomonas oligotrophica]|uniref:Tetratricopeptide repeat protein n=1 Tax=Cellulomonas oligotrophica TaxID=931536 RepID=A0A7Y9FCH0_9CELL|nr:tetratricopeptide repeat protein [Cellulomonas oligotrophica]NYD84522.1 hypothetical protein [Cellulomonas oligotrophica]
MTTGDAVATYTIDPTSLRERPDDVGASWARVEELEELGERGDGERVAWLRILGALRAAEDLAWDDVVRHGGPGGMAALLASGPGGVPVSALRPLLRLAQVLHHAGRHVDAERVLEQVRTATVTHLHAPGADERLVRECSAVMAFADHGQGKVLFDAGRPAEAVSLFRAALDRRLRDGAPEDQVESSRLALAAATHALQTGTPAAAGPGFGVRRTASTGR